MQVNSHRRRVVVTGLGCISPVGNSVKSAWESIVAGRSGIATVSRFDATVLPVHFAGEVKDFNVESYLPAKEARHM
ncbi:MAG: beta-ketoacyl synthase N-terminal-like domain-containing protein, partial [Burkholderiaceae bacterium]